MCVGRKRDGKSNDKRRKGKRERESEGDRVREKKGGVGCLREKERKSERETGRWDVYRPPCIGEAR